MTIRNMFLLAIVGLFAFFIMLGVLLPTPVPSTAQDRPASC